MRVVRNVKGRKHSKYAPAEGNRYDGIYKVNGCPRPALRPAPPSGRPRPGRPRPADLPWASPQVVRYWPEKGKSGFLVWRYLLRRDDTEPGPWTKEGKDRIKKLGLTMQVRPGAWAPRCPAHSLVFLASHWEPWEPALARNSRGFLVILNDFQAPSWSPLALTQ